MADLRSRLGPRISFNRTWIRPGHEIGKKSSPTKSLSESLHDGAQGKPSTLEASSLAGYSIDSDDKPHASETNATSFLQRQTQDNPKDEHVARSLLDRMSSSPRKYAKDVGSLPSWVGNGDLTKDVDLRNSSLTDVSVSQAVSDPLTELFFSSSSILCCP